MRVGILDLCQLVDARKNVGAQFEVEALGAFDLLFGALNIGIALQRRQDSLIKSVTWNAGAAGAAVCCFRSGKRPQGAGKKQSEDKAKLSHFGVKAETRGTLIGQPI